VHEVHRKSNKSRSKYLRDREHVEQRGVSEGTIFIRNIKLKGMDWIILAQDRDQWRADINTIMKLCVP